MFIARTRGEGAAAGSGFTWQIWRLNCCTPCTHTSPRAFISRRTPLRRIYTEARTSVSVLLSSYHHVLLRVLSDLIPIGVYRIAVRTAASGGKSATLMNNYYTYTRWYYTARYAHALIIFTNIPGTYTE